MEEYVALTGGPECNLAAIEDLLAPLDRSRAGAVERIIRIRHELRELLTDEQWQEVFG